MMIQWLGPQILGGRWPTTTRLLRFASLTKCLGKAQAPTKWCSLMWHRRSRRAMDKYGGCRWHMRNFKGLMVTLEVAFQHGIRLTWGAAEDAEAGRGRGPDIDQSIMLFAYDMRYAATADDCTRTRGWARGSSNKAQTSNSKDAREHFGPPCGWAPRAPIRFLVFVFSCCLAATGSSGLVLTERSKTLGRGLVTK